MSAVHFVTLRYKTKEFFWMIDLITFLSACSICASEVIKITLVTRSEALQRLRITLQYVWSMRSYHIHNQNRAVIDAIGSALSSLIGTGTGGLVGQRYV